MTSDEGLKESSRHDIPDEQLLITFEDAYWTSSLHDPGDDWEKRAWRAGIAAVASPIAAEAVAAERARLGDAIDALPVTTLNGLRHGTRDVLDRDTVRRIARGEQP